MACEVDDNTTYTAGNGLTLAGTTFSVNPAGFARAPAFSSTLLTFLDLTTTANVDLVSVTMTPPVNGTVLVTVAADLFCSGCIDATAATTYTLGITNVSGGAPLNPRIGRLPGGSSSAVSPITQMFTQQSFAVTGGVTTTFFFRGALFSGAAALRVLRPTIAAMFYPQ